ncbi:MAG TPA: NAD(+)/NADH kinase [Terriglobales bacterium]|nr:NAD(+)/NADH kinase [Terriglobales bacterium]
MKTVGIISKPYKHGVERVASQLVEWLRARGYRVVVDRETAEYAAADEAVVREELAGRKPEFVVVLGGDGTMLAAARALAKARIPILGVNLGALGFLTEIPLPDLYPTLEAVHEQRSAVEARAMVHCQLVRGGSCHAEYDALNDIVVAKSALARLVDFEVEIDGAFVSTYKADGIIVSTPTGSTAYSLAAGGPILLPNVDALVITPVSSHALTNRPLVVRDTSAITIGVKSTQEEAFLSVDGQVGMPVQDGDHIVCRKSDQQVLLLRLSSRTFFDVLRAKLKWGER